MPKAATRGRTVYDFGQNIGSFTIAFSVEGERGARVVVEHAEIVDHEGHFSNSNYRSAQARIEYVLKGGTVENYRRCSPSRAFRYARVTITGKARIVSIASVPISSAIDRAGTLTTSSPLVNRLVENTFWSQRGDFIEVPTDCPQRDDAWGGPATPRSSRRPPAICTRAATSGASGCAT